MTRGAVALLYGCRKAALGVKDYATRLNSKFGSGTGTRTLNLAVNRSAPPVQKSRAEFAECR